jgi:hypothetical protein
VHQQQQCLLLQSFLELPHMTFQRAANMSKRADDVLIWGGEYRLRWWLDPHVTNLSAYQLHADMQHVQDPCNRACERLPAAFGGAGNRLQSRN